MHKFIRVITLLCLCVATTARGEIILRHSTASQEVPLGHFTDSIDGDFEETGLSIANTDIKLWKHGATALVNKNSGGATHMAGGVYYAVLDATDTNTIGSLVIFCHPIGAGPVRVECRVLAAPVYDEMFGPAAISTLAGNRAGDKAAILSGAVASIAGQTQFTVAGSSSSWAGGVGPGQELVGQLIAIYDADDLGICSVRTIVSNTEGLVTIDAAPDFTLSEGDVCRIYPSYRNLPAVRTAVDTLLPASILASGTVSDASDQNELIATGSTPEGCDFDEVDIVIQRADGSRRQLNHGRVEIGLGGAANVILSEIPGFTYQAGDKFFALATPTRLPTITAAISAIKPQTDKLTFDGDNKVAANATAVVGEEAVDAIVEGVVAGVGSGGGTPAQVHNQPPVAARTAKIGTRADGVVKAYPAKRVIAGEVTQLWIDCSAMVGSNLLNAADAESTEEGVAIESIGVYGKLVSLVVDAREAEAGDNAVITCRVTPASNQAIIVSLDVEVKAAETQP